ncbi:unnamed protein product [Closterium sp. NIES-53]
MYLMTCTRPDLAYPLSILARYVAPERHRSEHWEAAKRVLRCLCSTSGMGLVLGGRGPVVLTGHADASWVDDLARQQLSQGYTFNLGFGSVSWQSTRFGHSKLGVRPVEDGRLRTLRRTELGGGTDDGGGGTKNGRRCTVPPAPVPPAPAPPAPASRASGSPAPTPPARGSPALVPPAPAPPAPGPPAPADKGTRAPDPEY